MAKWTLATQILSTIGQQNVRMFSRTACLASQTIDYYATLGVLKDAKQREIREAYEQIAKIHHPSDKRANPKRLQEAKEAFAVLGNIQNRRLFDQGSFFIEIMANLFDKNIKMELFHQTFNRLLFTGLGVFDIKSSIPKDDRIQHYKGLWLAEPRKKTMISSSDPTYENYQYTISRTHDQISDPDEKIKDEIITAGYWIIGAFLTIFAAGFLYDAFWRWELDQEMNKKQIKNSKRA